MMSSRRLLVGRSSSLFHRSTTRRTGTDNKLRYGYFSTTTTTTDSTTPTTDRLVVVGSGVAGSATALVAAEKYQIPVSLIFAGSIPHDCNSYWAQGGIIYENYKGGDSPQLLAQDICRAGAGLCQDDAVMKLATEGPGRVNELLLQGHPYAQVPFDTTSDQGDELSLCLEASHAVPRILHYADHTGKVITQHMTAAAANHPLITLVPDTLVTDILTSDDGTVCTGVETLDRTTNHTSKLHASRGTVLCAGGLGGIYQHSTNPAGFNALGSSVALVERLAKGSNSNSNNSNAQTLRTQDLEYVQFHPTSLCIPNEARFLLTEALRGEGALLRNAEGYAFARDFHPDGELAPRDIVARGVFAESQKNLDSEGQSHNVFLDITHRPAEYLRNRFPTIQTHLQSRGLDLTRDHLPVIPAAHYTCGGISTDLEGKTGLTNLYAAGEAARTGLHGGNRLASTSLLEGLVYGAAVADYCGSQEGQDIHNHVQLQLSQEQSQQQTQTTPPSSSINQNQQDAIVSHATTLLEKVRSVMWDHVGVVRTPSGITKALDALESLQQESQHLYDSHKCTETVGVRDAALAGQAVARAALANTQSAGAHFIQMDDGSAWGEDADTTPPNMAEDSDSDSDSDNERTAVAAQ